MKVIENDGSIKEEQENQQEIFRHFAIFVLNQIIEMKK